MKKMIAFVFVVIILMACGAIRKNNNLLVYADYAVVVTGDKLSAESFCTGGVYYTRFQKEGLDEIAQVKEIKGLILYFSNDKNIDFFSSQCGYISSKTMIEGRLVFYGYCAWYEDFVFNNGKKTNMQIVQTDDGWIVGLPMILTGF